jgi:predicted amidohydrolase
MNLDGESFHASRLEELARVPASPADVLLLPEMWTGEPRLDAESGLDAVSRVCRSFCTHAVTGGAPWNDGPRRVLRMWMIDDLGRAFAFYDRVHLSSRDGEDKTYASGDAPCVFNVGEVTCAALSGYDLMFPEFCRQLSLAGARVFFVSARWPEDLMHAWEFTIRACAFLNQVYVVACNGIGAYGNRKFSGRSLACSPSGGIIGGLGEGEGVLSVSFRLSETAKCRKNMPIERDRRREIYTILS